MAEAAVPMGMRFRPNDEEKAHFLLCKVTGQPLPCGDFRIATADLYGEKEPWEILLGDWEDDEEGGVCFFTMLKKIGKNNKRFSRNVGNGGTWSNKGQRAPIFGRKRGGGQLVGYKRCFRYEAAKANKEAADGGTWLLKEYTLPDHYKGGIKEEYKDYALCVLKRKAGKTPPPPPPPPHVVDESIGLDCLMPLGSGYGTAQQISHPEEESDHYYHAPPHDDVVHDHVGLDNYFQNHQGESNCYHPPAACDLRDIAQQFIREEQQSPYFHSRQHHYGNLFSQAQHGMTMSSPYYY